MDTHDFSVSACSVMPGDGQAFCSDAVTESFEVTPPQANDGETADALVIPLGIPDHDETAGFMAGNAGVAGGTATYSIPIAMAPGRRGMQPSVWLNYSSHAGNGIAGMGWSLSAGSAIHRCSATVAQDGFARGVTFDVNTDRLCLDGQRLVHISGPHNGSNSVYRTEIDSFNKVTMKGGDINGASTWFEVKTKSGMTLKYGNGNGSRLKPIGRVANETLSWMIRDEIDLHTNLIRYHYTAGAPGELLLNKISYTGHAGSEGDREVRFEYENRLKPSFAHMPGGGQTASTQRLETVKTFVGNNIVRAYHLGYIASNASGRSLLETVKVCADNTERICLAPTTFAWEHEAPSFSQPDHVTISNGMQLGPNDKASRSWDYDGDGIRELMVHFRHDVADHSDDERKIYSYYSDGLLKWEA
ncbi:MAG: hypothetical protein HKM24_00030, partial [Gammaproteobacteria bacterium]|nr:hypothetical protein [Gammaproteobacteria bacterium]